MDCPSFNTAKIVCASRPVENESLELLVVEGTIDVPNVTTLLCDLPPNAFSDPTLEITRVEIEMYFGFDPTACFAAIRERMRASPRVWRTATELNIKARAILDLDPPLFDYRAETSQFGAALAAAMPGVRDIYFIQGRNEGYAIRSLYGQLAALYADQLRTMSSDIPIVVPREHKFTRLEDVRLECDGRDGYQHPSVDPARLTHLTLVGWRPSHSWAPFSAGGDGWLIEFPNLKELVVKYDSGKAANGADVRHSDGYPWRLYFPALESLVVECQLDDCPLLQYVLLPPRISAISIKVRAPVFQRTMATSLPATRYLEIRSDSDASDDSTTAVAAGHILEDTWGRVETVIDADSPFSTVFGAGVCGLITDLSVPSAVTATAMTWLIINLHSLTSLKIDHLSLSDISPNSPLQLPVGPYQTGALNLNIRRLEISADHAWRAHRALVFTIVYVLLRLPELISFSAKGIPRDLFLECARGYFGQYPHMSRIVYAFGH